MDTRSLQFIEVMMAIVAVAILAFLVFLISRFLQKQSADMSAEPGSASHWFPLLLAGLLLAIAAAAVIWIVFPEGGLAAWSEDPRATVFLLVMVAIGALALIVFVIGAFVATRRRAKVPPAPGEVPQPVPGKTASDDDENAVAQPSPSGLRLIGLVAIGFALLILSWAALDHGTQHALAISLIYPAAFAVAVVLLFDKATRAWSEKGAAESLREWLLCDTIVLLLVLAYLNARGLSPAENYRSIIWDMLGIAGFFLTFWVLDRTASRYRFLIAYLFLIALPILQILWAFMNVAPEAADRATTEAVSWWSTVWPFFFLAIIFGVLELIALVAAREEDRHGIPAVKDALFVGVYAILLLVAIP